MKTLKVEPAKAQQLTEIGAQLRKTREQGDVSLEDISARTMIPTRLLMAIEAGQADLLPEAIYTKGFIRRFADHLGLNGDQLAEKFAGPTAEEVLEESKNRKKRRRQPFSFNFSGTIRPVHLYLLYVVLIVGAGVGLSYMTNQSALTFETGSAPKPEAAQPQSKEKVEVAKEGAIAKNSNPPAATNPTPATAPIQPVNNSTSTPAGQLTTVRVDLSIKQDSWVEIVVDGKVDYAGTLTSGTNKTVVAKEQLVIRAGNAGGVMVAVDNKPAKQMGQPGSVEELILKPESLALQPT